MESFNYPLWIHLKSARKLVVGCSGKLAAMPTSSTYCPHWSALLTGPKYSRIKLEKDDSDLLRPWASLRYANVLPAKLNASIFKALWSAICKQWYAWEHSTQQKKSFPTMCCEASVSVLTG